MGVHTESSNRGEHYELRTPLVSAMLHASAEVTKALPNSADIKHTLRDHIGGTIIHRMSDIRPERLDNARIVIDSGTFSSTRGTMMEERR